jgi:hypothetical protein
MIYDIGFLNAFMLLVILILNFNEREKIAVAEKEAVFREQAELWNEEDEEETGDPEELQEERFREIFDRGSREQDLL